MPPFILRAVGPAESIVWRLDTKHDAEWRMAHIKSANGSVAPFGGIRYAILAESVDAKYVLRDEWCAIPVARPNS